MERNISLICSPLLVAFFFLPFFIAHADEVTGFLFTSVSSFAAGEHTQISVQSQNTTGGKTDVSQTTCLHFTTTSATAMFSASNTVWEPLPALTVTMSKNSANRNVYYAESVAGVSTISLRAVMRPADEKRACANWPLAEWPTGFTATQQITVGTVRSEANASTSPSSQDIFSALSVSSSVPIVSSTSGGGGGTESLKPNLFVYATVPARTVVGADALFEAAALGIKKEPILNARYIWSFGDGGTVEGKKVLHVYHYPGNYVVMVEVSSGEYSATDRKDIAVSAPALSIVHIKEGTDGFIEVYNGGAADLDLSRWFLQSNQTIFSFPKGTILQARQAVPFPAAITNISAVADTTAVLYPNGTVAARYAPPAELPAPPVSLSVTLPAATVVVPRASGALAPAPEISPAPTVLVPSSPTPLQKSILEISEENTPSSSIIVPSRVSSSELLLAAAQTSGGTGGIWVWIVAVAVLLGASVGGYALSFRAPVRELTDAEQLKREAEEYELIE